MKTVQFAISLIAFFAGISIKSSAQEAKSAWQTDAEAALEGTWDVAEFDVPRIAKLKIVKVGDGLKILFWGRDASTSEPDGAADTLHVLSRYPDSKFEDEETALAFATHKADSGVMHFTLRIHEDVLHLEGVKIVSDDRAEGHRLITATYTKSDALKPPGKDIADKATADDGDKKMADSEKTKASLKRGKLAGRIESGSTLRGRLTLSPEAEKVAPADGIEIGSSNPQFEFTNVPEGEYSLTFQGTVNGVTKRLSWPALEADVTGKESPLSLSIKAGGSR